MSDQTLNPLRIKLHPSITPDQISRLVETFYDRVHHHALLSPIFAQQTTEAWDVHLDKMKSFWRSVLLKTGEYKGKPVPAHQKLEGVTTQHFQEWIELFSSTSREVFELEAAELVIATAKNIATSLWLSRSTDPFVSPPDWNPQNQIVSSPETFIKER